VLDPPPLTRDDQVVGSRLPAESVRTHPQPRGGTPVAKLPRGGPAAELSDLMAAAGNRAVARLVRTLQREDYTKPVSNVRGTGITRLEVHGLKFGTGEFQAGYAHGASDEKNKTAESPSHMAVVLVPDTLDLDKPVQVILHFHGWIYRTWDPYAGYLVAKPKSSAPAGTVRDVDQEHWEQQMSSLAGQGPQVVAVLAQGRGESDFGTFPTFEYIYDVFKKSGRADLDKLADAGNYSVVFSAHSGGGSTKVVPILGAKEAETRDRGALPTQTPANPGDRVVNQQQPVDLVVLYEALNGDGDVLATFDWIQRQLKRIVPQLDTAPDKALASTPVFRGYYGDRDGSGYREQYRWLACLIKEEIQSRVPAVFQQAVADHFRIIEVQGPAIDPPPKKKGARTHQAVEHEKVISGLGAENSGSLANALRASRDPAVDRAEAVVPDDAECKRLKLRAQARAEERARKAREKAEKDKAEREAKEKIKAPQ
jgi:hypothetical protein